MKIYLTIATIILIGLGVYIFKPKSNVINPTTPPTTPTAMVKAEKEIAATFEIYTNGTKRIFTDPKYHNLSSAAYINPQNPNRVIVTTEKTTWDDFFKTLPMSLTSDCLITGTKQTFCTGTEGELRFYINDLQNPEALKMIIKNGDKLRVVFD